jgi:ABC-type Fe3+-siderophore transport system permease subunit
MRALVTALSLWLILIAIAAMFGGLTSFITGKSADLPQWNGWSYLFFSVKEGALFAILLTWPLPLFLFLVFWFGSNRRDSK